MRAMLLDAPAPIKTHPLRLGDVRVPEPANDEVRVKVNACGVCRTDLHVCEGDLEVRRSPVIPGHQIVGTIDTLGANVVEREVGQRVGVAWLHRTCGCCTFCASARENWNANRPLPYATRPGSYHLWLQLSAPWKAAIRRLAWSIMVT